MKITATAGDLSAALAAAARLSDGLGITVEALRSVLLSTSGDALTITANILDRQLTLTVPATIAVPGKVAVNASRLAGLVAGFPESAAVEIGTDGAAATVRAGRARYCFPVAPLDNMPP